MEISGKIIQINAEQSGNSRNGNTWRKKEYILETAGTYPKKVCLAVWGDKIDQFDIQEGDEITAGIEVESREYNGKWYTDVKAWKVDKMSGATSTPQHPSAMPDVTSFSEESDDDVLPF